MTMLQIKQLKSIERITCKKQKQIYGSFAGGVQAQQKYSSLSSEEALWNGYAGGSLDIKSNGTAILFAKDDKYLAGTVSI